MTQAALDLTLLLCRHFEGFSSVPYRCPAGVWTIGYGSTRYADGRPVGPDDPPIFGAEALALLIGEILGRFAPGVLRQCPGLAVLMLKEPGRMAAITDFAYNLGIGRLQTSTLRRAVNKGDWQWAQEELKKWVRGGGRILPGLVLRRKAEAQMLGANA